MGEEVIIGNARLIHGDCRDILPTLPKVSAVVTDPPYGLRFMGKRWDYDVPDSALWALVLDRLLPGGHLLAFAGTRTQHRMAVRIEDAGFEIRDMLAWVYGSGFPKSLDVGKAIDKAAGIWRGRHGVKLADDKRSMGQHYCRTSKGEPATEAARQWNGWGTALKPALEPITLARKPLAGTVAQNVQAHGTGGLNIDGCRVGNDGGCAGAGAGARVYGDGLNGSFAPPIPGLGRWPANLIHDGSDEVVALFPQTSSGELNQAAISASNKIYSPLNGYRDPKQYAADAGSAARFFYCAKASTAERDADNNHPTVKPIALMRWLLTLVTPPGGWVLDPFAGSGSTGVAAAQLGMRFVGIERERRYFDIACERIALAQAQGTLFTPDPPPDPPRECVQEGLL